MVCGAIAQKSVVENQANDTVCNWDDKLVAHVVQLSANMDGADKKKRRDLVARYVTGDRKGDADAVVKRWNKAHVDSASSLAAVEGAKAALEEIGIEWTEEGGGVDIDGMSDEIFIQCMPPMYLYQCAMQQPDAFVHRLRELFYGGDQSEINERMQSAGFNEQDCYKREMVSSFIIKEFIDYQRTVSSLTFDVVVNKMQHTAAVAVHHEFTTLIKEGKKKEKAEQRRLLDSGVASVKAKKLSPFRSKRISPKNNTYYLSDSSDN